MLYGSQDKQSYQKRRNMKLKCLQKPFWIILKNRTRNVSLSNSENVIRQSINN